MKKMFLFAFVVMIAMGASAQMNVWENGGLSAQYAIESVDSVTFGITSETPSSGTGKDGITPLLKIENDYWFISYDEGKTWTQEGKAKGDKGDNGVKGDKGDSMFQSVTQDDNYVYFTLADGTVIKIAKGNGNSQSNDDFIFTITYDPNGGEGVMAPDTFYYGLNMTKTLTCHYTKDKYYLTEWNTKSNGSGVSYPLGCVISIDKNITLYAQWKKCLGNPSEYVDLGLSVKWATCNVGASKPEEYGDYFAWGENHPKSTYNWSTYKWCDGSETTLTKYNSNSSNGIVDNKRTLELDDDAARVNWGGSWRIPTTQELEELRTECTWILTTQNGVKGYNVTSKNNGNSIFLPAAGYHGHGGIDYAGTYFHCWSNSLSTVTSANTLSTVAPPIVVNSGLKSRYYGLSVRPVCH
ncbi:MAG: InlB B-repeat-containing protein [Paludibacteraceae bacterium]|nr:InlB B-repeat-containing protein [Paludibacteraceae bacterium]